MATFANAARCPRCSETGREAGARTLDRVRGKLVTLLCENKRCKWYNTTWVVQVRPDGTVPEPDTSPRSGTIHVASPEEIARIERNAQAALDGSLRGGEIQK